MKVDASPVAALQDDNQWHTSLDAVLPRIALPWPPQILSPNARPNWRLFAKAKAAYKAACHWAVLEAKQQDAVRLWTGPISVQLTFVPPNRIRRDRDNLIASVKAGLDGLAAGLGVDDSRFRLPEAVLEDRVAGIVYAELSPWRAPAAEERKWCVYCGRDGHRSSNCPRRGDVK